MTRRAQRLGGPWSLVLLAFLGPLTPSSPAAEDQAPRPPVGRLRGSRPATVRPRATATGREVFQAAGPSVEAATTTAYPYVAIPIPPPADRTRTRAYGINNQGQVAARASNYSDADQREIERLAFVWDPQNGSRPLPTLSGQSGVWGLNNAGILSGYSYTSAGLQHAVRWDTTALPMALTDIGTLPNATSGAHGDTSTAYDLSESALVTGYSDIPNDDGTIVPFHAILYDETAGLRDLGTFDTTYPQYQHGYSISYDANALGQVVGLAHSTEGGPWHFLPFIYDSTGGLRALERDGARSDPAQEWYAVAINDAGLIGGHVIAAPNQSLPYYWPNDAASPVALAMPAAHPYGEIYGMNAQGEMVGVMWDDAGAEHAFFFDTNLGVRDLNALVDPAAGWVVQFARDINDSGQIVGSGTVNGIARGFLLTPSELVRGRIAGAVRHKVTGAPLPGVGVRIYDSAGTLAHEATTDSQGQYLSDWLSPGTYFAVTSNTLGFPEQLYQDLACVACDPTTGTPVNVTVGAVISTVDFEIGPPPPPPSEDVAWTNVVGASVSGSTLTKTVASAWGNASATSTKSLLTGDGAVEFTAAETRTLRILGLSNGNSNSRYEDVDFGLYLLANARLQVYEKGVLRGTFGGYAAGDRLRVAVASGVVRYYRNGTLLYTSRQAPTYPLLVDTALHTRNATLKDASLIGVWMGSVTAMESAAWTAAVGVSVSGSDLTKTASGGWGNAGAFSTKSLLTGDGAVEFTAAETRTSRMLGLSNGNSDNRYQDIDFGLYLLANAKIQVYEKGVLRGTFGGYAAGDRLRVAVASGVVRYSRNGTLLYTSRQAPAYPLLVDTALYSKNATLKEAGLIGPWQ